MSNERSIAEDSRGNRSEQKIREKGGSFIHISISISIMRMKPFTSDAWLLFTRLIISSIWRGLERHRLPASAKTSACINWFVVARNCCRPIAEADRRSVAAARATNHPATHDAQGAVAAAATAEAAASAAVADVTSQIAFVHFVAVKASWTREALSNDVGRRVGGGSRRRPSTSKTRDLFMTAARRRQRAERPKL